MEKVTFEIPAPRAVVSKPPVVEPITITENGEFTAPEGVDGYNPVNVEVSIPPPPVLVTINIKENGKYVPGFGEDGFDEVTVDVDIPKSDGSWQPQQDWWDIEKIFKDDPDPNKRFILLLTDSLPTFVLDNTRLGNSAAYYKTHEGSDTYNEGGTIAWDVTKDKPCAKGYKTRYLIVYSEKNAVNCNIADDNNNYCKYAYFGNGSELEDISFGGKYPNILLECVKIDDVKFAKTSDAAFSCCHSLQAVILSDGVHGFGAETFTHCYSLKRIRIPSGVVGMDDYMLGNCTALESVTIPSSVIYMEHAFYNCPSLVSIEIYKGWVAPPFSISESTLFPESSAIKLFSTLGAAPTARALTFGPTLLNRWSAGTKAIATKKGYTLA
jgi:hypothetical protein